MSFDRVWHRHYPSGVPPELDFQRLTMPEFLSRSAERWPHRPALHYLGKDVTFSELEGQVNRFARALEALGVKPGDRVATLLPNLPQIVIAHFATYRIGAVTAPANPLYTERELEHHLADSGARVLVALDLLQERIQAVRTHTALEEVVVCHLNDYLPFPKKQLFPLLKRALHRNVRPAQHTHRFLDLIRAHPADPVPNRARWEETGALLYTGGTTGVSKGAVLTHANLSCNVQQVRTFLVSAVDGEERELAVFPFFHSAGYTGVENMCVCAGWTDVLVPRPDPDILVSLIQTTRPTIVPGVPTIYTGLLAHPRFAKLDLSFVKAFLAGAAPLPVDTVHRLRELTGGTIYNVYGLTEISPMGTATPEGGPDRPGTVGVPIPNTDLRLVDLVTGETEVPLGEPGEVCFKGPQVMVGYHNRPEETARVLRDGWLHTGDIGVMDEDGYLTIVDRSKDMIVASGYNVYPNEIDAVLFEHPRILEACTVGVPDPYRGETAKAFVVVRPGETLTAEEVVAWCRQSLAPYKVPTEVEFLAELPKSAVGKILRRELRTREGESG